MNEQIARYVAAIVREQFLLEAANSAQDAESLGLAMFQRASDFGNYAVLYSPAKLAKFDNFVKSKDFVALSDAVYGYFSWKPADGKCHASVIKTTVAKKGWGPFLYDYVMSQTDLMPDRGFVSKEAKPIWQKYFTSRQDVKKIPVDKVNCEKYDPDEEETNLSIGNEKYLDYVYSMKGSSNSYDMLKQNHKRFVDDLWRNKKIPASSAEEQLYYVGVKYFLKEFRRVSEQLCQ